MTRVWLALMLPLVAACKAEKRPPTDADFVPNPPIPAPRAARAPVTPPKAPAESLTTRKPKRPAPPPSS